MKRTAFDYIESTILQTVQEHLSELDGIYLHLHGASEVEGIGSGDTQNANVLPAPATDLAYVVHPWAVSSRRLLDAGWRPTYDNETCLGQLLEEVRGHHAVAARRQYEKGVMDVGNAENNFVNATQNLRGDLHTIKDKTS